MALDYYHIWTPLTLDSTPSRRRGIERGSLPSTPRQDSPAKPRGSCLQTDSRLMHGLGVPVCSRGGFPPCDSCLRGASPGVFWSTPSLSTPRPSSPYQPPHPPTRTKHRNPPLLWLGWVEPGLDLRFLFLWKLRLSFSRCGGGPRRRRGPRSPRGISGSPGMWGGMHRYRWR